MKKIVKVGIKNKIKENVDDDTKHFQTLFLKMLKTPYKEKLIKYNLYTFYTNMGTEIYKYISQNFTISKEIETMRLKDSRFNSFIKKCRDEVLSEEDEENISYLFRFNYENECRIGTNDCKVYDLADFRNKRNII